MISVFFFLFSSPPLRFVLIILLKKMCKTFWINQRHHFTEISRLISKVDDSVAMITAFSLSSNLYYILLQLLHSFQLSLLCWVSPQFAHTHTHIYIHTDTLHSYAQCAWIFSFPLESVLCRLFYYYYCFLIFFIRPQETFFETVYFWFSLLFLMSRAMLVSLSAARINDESKYPASILRAIPSEGYDAEVSSRAQIKSTANEKKSEAKMANEIINL